MVTVLAIFSPKTSKTVTPSDRINITTAGLVWTSPSHYLKLRPWCLLRLQIKKPAKGWFISSITTALAFFGPSSSWNRPCR